MGQPMKVLHVIGGGEFGGAEQHILSLLEGFDRSIIDAEVISFYDSFFAQTLRERGYSVTVIQTTGRYDYRIYKRLVELFSQKKPVILHTHGVRANFFARLAGRKAKVPHIVTTVHSFLRNDYPNNVAYFFANAMERGTQQLTEHFIVVSKALKEHLCSKGIPENRISIIYNGINLDLYSDSEQLRVEAALLREGQNILSHNFVVGTTVRLVPVKGLTYLLEGFAMAVQHDPNLSLFIVGTGPEREALQHQTQQLGIADNVHFLGFRTDIPVCLVAMDMYINTSLSEGQSISLLEAMALAKPAAVTKVGGMQEMIVHGESGLFIQPSSAQDVRDVILRYKSSPELRSTLGVAAKKVAEDKYSMTTMNQQMMDIYLSLMESEKKHVE